MAIPVDINAEEMKISVTIRAFASLREVMDAEIRLSLDPPATIRTLLTLLSGRYAGLDALLFSSPGNLKDFVNILKNGRNIAFLAGLDTPLSEGDVIALFPPAAGG